MDSVPPPSGLAVFPHPALRLMVLPPRGLTFQTMGHCQVEQPKVVKERILVTLFILTLGNSGPIDSLAHQRTQTAPDPHVDLPQALATTVFEVANQPGSLQFKS